MAVVAPVRPPKTTYLEPKAECVFDGALNHVRPVPKYVKPDCSRDDHLPFRLIPITRARIICPGENLDDDIFPPAHVYIVWKFVRFEGKCLRHHANVRPQELDLYFPY